MEWICAVTVVLLILLFCYSLCVVAAEADKHIEEMFQKEE